MERDVAVVTTLGTRARALHALIIMTADVVRRQGPLNGWAEFLGVLVDRFKMYALVVESLIFESLVKILQRPRSIEKLVGVDEHATVQFLLDLLSEVTVPALKHLLSQHLSFAVPARCTTFSLGGGSILGHSLSSSVATTATSRAAG